MFSYYGSKSKVVKYYPEPMYDTIIEPFAGSARYSLHGDNWKRNVILVDKYDVIVSIWSFLIKAKEEDVLSLPKLGTGQSLDEFQYSDIRAKYLMGFLIKSGVESPRLTASSYRDFDYIETQKQNIANNLYKIRHWKVVQGDYHCVSNKHATYYIDPPYEYGGEYYKHSNKRIDYNELREWCLSRKGQVIVCENTKATWMDFTPLKSMHGSKHTTTEAMWTNMPQVEQLQLE